MNKPYKYRHYKETRLAINALRKVVTKSDSAFISIRSKIIIDSVERGPGLYFFGAVHCKVIDSHFSPFDATQNIP